VSFKGHTSRQWLLVFGHVLPLLVGANSLPTITRCDWSKFNKLLQILKTLKNLVVLLQKKFIKIVVHLSQTKMILWYIKTLNEDEHMLIMFHRYSSLRLTLKHIRYPHTHITCNIRNYTIFCHINTSRYNTCGLIF